jgi:hypothetical protein
MFLHNRYNSLNKKVTVQGISRNDDFLIETDD